MEAKQPKSVKVPELLLQLRGGSRSAHRQGGRRRRHRDRAELRRLRRLSGARQVLRQGLRTSSRRPTTRTGSCTPMKRTNPKKGRTRIRASCRSPGTRRSTSSPPSSTRCAPRASLDEAGCRASPPASAAAARRPNYMGTFPAFLSPPGGPVDFSFGRARASSAMHSEHLYGELWHRAFTVSADTPSCEYMHLLRRQCRRSRAACAPSPGATPGARPRRYKRVQLEPHNCRHRRRLGRVGADQAEDRPGLPVRPDPRHAARAAAHAPRRRIPAGDHTGSPYLIGPHGFYLRDPRQRKPLVWDASATPPCRTMHAGADPALEGRFTARRA
jgi:phenylacetyl-CoA:acceptor oxidoreductase